LRFCHISNEMLQLRIHRVVPLLTWSRLDFSMSPFGLISSFPLNTIPEVNPRGGPSEPALRILVSLAVQSVQPPTGRVAEWGEPVVGHATTRDFRGNPRRYHRHVRSLPQQQHVYSQSASYQPLRDILSVPSVHPPLLCGRRRLPGLPPAQSMMGRPRAPRMIVEPRGTLRIKELYSVTPAKIPFPPERHRAGVPFCLSEDQDLM
jgi:hypothetical protein